MIAPGDTAEYRSLYLGPHEPYVRVEVWDDTEQLVDDLPILTGEVKATLGSQVTRTGTISVDRALYPAGDPTGLLAPFGNRLKIYRGIRRGDGRRFEFPVFTGLITKATRKARQPAVISFADRAAEVAENAFEEPEESRPGRPVVEEIERLIREGVPGAEFGSHDPIAALAAPQVWESSRAQACDALAAAGGAFWYCLADGRYVIRRVPWTWHADADPVTGSVPTVAELHDAPSGQGPAPDGVIEDADESLSRDDVYNAVVGSADRGDGTAPVHAVARDQNQTSPTYYSGKFGRRVVHVDVPAGNAAAVQAATATYLRRSLAAADVLTWQMVPDPSLELGDVAGVTAAGLHRVQVLAEATMPLIPNGRMSCTGRSLVLPSGVVARGE